MCSIFLKFSGFFFSKMYFYLFARLWMCVCVCISLVHKQQQQQQLFSERQEEGRGGEKVVHVSWRNSISAVINRQSPLAPCHPPSHPRPPALSNMAGGSQRAEEGKGGSRRRRRRRRRGKRRRGKRSFMCQVSHRR